MIHGFEVNNPQAKFICVDSKHVNYPIKLFWMIDINRLLG